MGLGQRLAIDTPPAAAAVPTSARAGGAPERWARAVAALIDTPGDPKTLAAWGSAIGVNRDALRSWCRAAGVPSKSSLDLARLLRAVGIGGRNGWDLFNLLDIIDERTLTRLLERGGVSELRYAGGPPEIGQFLRRQRFVQCEAALRELHGVLARRGLLGVALLVFS